MASLVFNPVWQTNADLGSLNEGDSLVKRLVAVSSSSTMVSAGATSLLIGPRASELTELRFNNVVTSFSISGESIIFAARASNSNASLTFSTPLEFSVIAGTLPPGFTLAANGVLSGTLGDISSGEPSDFFFTVRAKSGTRVADRLFSIRGIPNVEVPVWDTTILPAPITDAAIAPRPYYFLGTVARGEPFTYTFDATNPEGMPQALRVQVAPDLVAPESNGALPTGLVVSNSPMRLTGAVSSAASPGSYYFDLALDAVVAPTPLLIRIDVSEDRVTEIASPTGVDWLTPEGFLGNVLELDSCELSVAAIGYNGEPVTYALSPDSADLPPGLTFNGATGEFRGRARFVEGNSDYVFRIRAFVSPTVFADRNFTITVVERYRGKAIMDVALRFQGPDREALATTARANIESEWLYRPDDPLFGLQIEPVIYIVGGLQPASLSSIDYRNTVAIRLGDYRHAVVRGQDGAIVYEVVYREIIDPMARAGGFVEGENVVPVERAVTDVHKAGARIHPASIRNIRFELISEIGFATDQPLLRHRAGLGGAEPLPRWMVERQDDGSVPGFKLATVLGYVKPGFGAQAVAALAAAQPLIGDRQTIEFDRLFVTTIDFLVTTFDDGDLVPKVAPVVIPAGVDQLPLGRWAAVANEIFVVETGEILTLGVRFTRTGETLHFDAAGTDRTFLIYVEGDPEGDTVPNVQPGDEVHLGPLIDGVSQIVINNVPSSLLAFEPLSDGFVFPLSSPPSEVVVKLSPTTFETITFALSAETADRGKYLKLTGVRGRK